MSPRTHSRAARTAPRRQQGVALAVVLILLLVVTLLALASLRGTLMEQRMSASMRDRSLSFQVTEAALREAERTVGIGKPAPPAAPGARCAAGICRAPDLAGGDSPTPWLVDANWDGASANSYQSPVVVPEDDDGVDMTSSPRVMVELMATDIVNNQTCTTSGDVSPDAACSQFENRYRITARTAEPGRAEIILQSMLSAP
jgi:type IV pilus assembly protein PilX